jgi:phage terminase small subunit
MGRPSKPIDLMIQSGKKHLTKKEIEERRELEIKLGDQELSCPDFVKKDLLALKKWKEVKKIYECEVVKRMQLISSGDVGHLGRYCKTFSEYQDLIERREHLEEVRPFTPEEEEKIDIEFEGKLGNRGAAKMWQKIEFIMSTNGILAIDKAINSKMASLVAMEDRLFLNPASKVKAIPKKMLNPPKPKTKLQKLGFDL